MLARNFMTKEDDEIRFRDCPERLFEMQKRERRVELSAVAKGSDRQKRMCIGAHARVGGCVCGWVRARMRVCACTRACVYLCTFACARTRLPIPTLVSLDS